MADTRQLHCHDSWHHFANRLTRNNVKLQLANALCFTKRHRHSLAFRATAVRDDRKITLVSQ